MGTFAERLKSARLAKGLRQRDLRDAAGVTEQMISRYERGIHTPETKTLVRLAEALDVSISDLLGTEAA